jgi:cyclase
MIPLIAALIVSSVFAALAAAEDSGIFKITELTENLHMLSTDHGDYTTNTLLFFGDDGILLVDTQTESEAEELKKIVESYGKGIPKYIINTHRHVEHIGGNAIFGKEPVVIAHELVPSKLRSGSYLFNEYPPATYPDITIADSLTLYFNNERIRVISMCGSHDDNEIIVHFTKSKVVHLSSLVNGFNFPSVDSDGDALRFPELVARAMDLLPHDVVIVSGHNGVGTWDDLQTYHEMLVQTIGVVRNGLAEGKDVATLQEENVLANWESYAGSYVSPDDWIEYVADRIQHGKDTRPTPHEPVYYAWKEHGAEAAVALFRELKRDHSDEYLFRDSFLLGIGMKLLEKDRSGDAIVFLEASLEEYPDAKYTYYTHYELADAYNRLGKTKPAREHCEKALELKPDFADATALLEELKTK